MKTAGGFLSATLAAVLCISSNLLAYSGGDGTVAHPYQIANLTDFQQFSAISADWSKSFILTANINLTSLTFTQAAIAPDTDTENEQFDFMGTPFTGIFDGNGHVVSNLTITEPEKDFIGLFGAVGSDSQVKNLGLENVNITGRSLVGGLVGQNDGVITGCHVTGSVSGDTMVGGLIAYNASGSLTTSCYVTGSVSSNYGVGGLVGTNWGTLTGCSASGSVIGGGCAGGLVGENDRTITSCYATGSVIATSSHAGGLVGLNYSSTTLSYCYATGSVTGTGFVGGLVGKNDSGAITSTITYCYATGAVSGSGAVGGLVGVNSSCTLSSCYATGSVIGTSSYVGGLVGWNDSTITSCYATGNASGIDDVGGLLGYNHYGSLASCYATGSVSGTNYVGGLVGWYFPGALLSACLWDINTSLTSNGVGNVDPDPAGVTGKPTVEMKTLSTFIDEGWDFSATDGNPADWMMPANSYPQLAWQSVIPGDIAGSYGVNLIDFAAFAAHWNQSGCPTGCGNADLNSSGTVDTADLTLFADNWLEGI